MSRILSSSSASHSYTEASVAAEKIETIVKPIEPAATMLQMRDRVSHESR